MNIKRRKEIIKLLNAHYFTYKYPNENIEGTISSEDIEDVAHVKIIDSYITDGPGFCGTLVFVVFMGDPSFHQVFGISSNILPTMQDTFKLQIIKQDEGYTI